MLQREGRGYWIRQGTVSSLLPAKFPQDLIFHSTVKYQCRGGEEESNLSGRAVGFAHCMEFTDGRFAKEDLRWWIGGLFVEGKTAND
jgi:hypothetical protein